MTDLLTPETTRPRIENEPAADETDLLVESAVLDALRDHRRAGNPVAVWEDGKVKIVPPEEIVLPDEKE